MTAFMRYCERATSRSFTDYWSFQSFAAEDFRLFWRLFFAWSELVFEGQLDPVCLGDSSESASFFPNLRLNYAEVLLADRGGGDDRPALTACHVDGRTERLSRGELRERALSLARSLWRLGAIVARDNGAAPSGLAKPFYRFADLMLDSGPPDGFEWRRFPFNQPLFILFSSGTTGEPKCIEHGAGGTLLEHLKEHRLHCDLKPGEKLFFQTSCAWMIWHWQLSALASGAELVLYDGPIEGPETLWRVVAAERVTVFGTNPAYLQFCQQAGFEP